MDESTESPTTAVINESSTVEDEKVDSGDEDEMLDWSKLAPKPSRASRSLPKRGEKAFEPIATGPSGYQKFTLERARQAMYDALSTPREVQTKRLSQAIWMPNYSRAQVVDSRGTAFGTLGYTIRRPEYTEKRLELLPEEALYLVERGSMLCWKQAEGLMQPSNEDTSDPIQIIGEPMSVQQCFMSMLGVENITLEHYQVYAYLKRFGYIIRRAQPLPSTNEYTIYRHPRPITSIFTSLSRLLSRFLNSFKNLFINWWHRFRPSIISHFRRDLHYPSIFRSYRIIPTKSPYTRSPSAEGSPYQVFYHVWKPEAVWNRVQPLRPDFEVVVINARKTPVPSFLDFEALYGSLPSIPLTGTTNKVSLQTRAQNPLARLLVWIRAFFQPLQIRINPFKALKEGKKSVIFAVVDAGTMTMYRFNEGCFDEWPMI